MIRKESSTFHKWISLDIVYYLRSNYFLLKLSTITFLYSEYWLHSSCVLSQMLYFSSYIKQCATSTMNLTLYNFTYLGICPEDFLFGELFVLQLRKPCLKKFKITLYRTSILAYSLYICIIMHPKKGPAITQNHILCALCLICLICGSLCPWYHGCLLYHACKYYFSTLRWSVVQPDNMILMFLISFVVQPVVLVAATSSPNVFLYARLTIPFHSVYLFSLQKYTVAGLCGVAISVLLSFLQSCHLHS